MRCIADVLQNCYTVGTKKYKEGVALLDIDSNKAMDALGNTRNQLTHYNCDPQKRSLGDYISDP